MLQNGQSGSTGLNLRLRVSQSSRWVWWSLQGTNPSVRWSPWLRTASPPPETSNMRSVSVLTPRQALTDLLFRIVVLNNVNELSDLEGEFIHILGLIFIGSFHFVEDTWWQVVRGGAWKQGNVFIFLPDQVRRTESRENSLTGGYLIHIWTSITI